MKLQTLHLSKERTFRKPPVPGTASPSSGAAASRLRTAQASSFEYQKKESPLDGSSRSRADPKIPAWIKVTFCDIIAKGYFNPRDRKSTRLNSSHPSISYA